MGPKGPRGPKAGPPPVWPRRQLIYGIRFRVRAGVPWRDVPVECGPWGPDLRPVPPVATGRYLAPGPHPAPVPRRCERLDHVGAERRLHGMPCSSACGRGPEAGRTAEGTAGRPVHPAS
ncbi:transposase [Streptomyces sp. NPDC059885]